MSTSLAGGGGNSLIWAKRGRAAGQVIQVMVFGLYALNRVCNFHANLS